MPKKPRKKSSRGGARPGAGRPRVHPDGAAIVSASLPPELAERIRQVAAEHQLTVTDVIRQAVESWIDSRGPKRD